MAMTAPPLETVICDLNGNTERCLIARAGSAPKLLIIPPLFEEANKMRRFMTQLMLHLAQHHAIASILPDLPGTLESVRALSDIALQDWQNALSDTLKHNSDITHIAALRGGCSITAHLDALPQWHFAPLNPWRQIRTLARAQLASDREAGHNAQSLNDVINVAEKNGAHLAGYNLSARLISDLKTLDTQTSASVHNVALSSDDKPADTVLDGTPLWLRAEPDYDAAMALAAADNIAKWMA